MKKKIRFFITTLNAGGAEGVLINLLKWLDQSRFDISLLTIYGGSYSKRLPPYVKYRCIVKSGRFGGFLKKVLLKLPPKLFACLFLKGSYDHEVAYLEGAPTAFLSAKKTKGIKSAFVHCDLSVNRNIYPLYSNPEKCIETYNRFDNVCFVSDDAREGFVKTFGQIGNARVVHNVIDIDSVLKLAGSRIDCDYGDADLKLITVGRLAPEKNYTMLLSVVSELSREYKIELWILGDGVQMDLLKQTAAEKSLTNVRFFGYTENPYPYIKKADLFVCSSRFEGYSTAVLESVILSTPVITTDCAGMSEILGDNRYGLIVDNSRDGLKNGLASFLKNPGLLENYRKNLESFSKDELPFYSDYNELFENQKADK